MIETTGTEDKIDSLVEVLRPYGVIEMVRTGRVAMARGMVRERPRANVARQNADGATSADGDASNYSA